MRAESRTHPAPHPAGHLSDDQLMESFVLSSESEHLRVCGECRARFQNLVGTLEQIREEAVSEADAIFTVERLHEQRDRVLRRLERHAHPAEVLVFPDRSRGHQAAYRLLPARRWVAGAAVAGLVAGLFLGFAVDRRVGSVSSRAMKSPAAGAAAWQRVSNDEPAMTAMRDEQILTDIEDALTGPHRVLEMRVLDDMTTPFELQKEASLVPR
jgi:hypothetical protein